MFYVVFVLVCVLPLVIEDICIHDIIVMRCG